MPGQFVLTPKKRMLRVGGSRVSRTRREEIPAAKRSPPNSGAYHVQESAKNEQRAKPYQEHFRLSIHRCPAQQNWNQSREGRIRSGRNNRKPRSIGAGVIGQRGNLDRASRVAFLNSEFASRSIYAARLMP